MPAFCKLELSIRWNSFQRAFTQMCHKFVLASTKWTEIPEVKDVSKSLFSSYTISDLSLIIHKYVLEPSTVAAQTQKYQIGYTIPYQRVLYTHVPINTDTNEVTWYQNSRDITSLAKVIICLRRESDCVENCVVDHFGTYMGGSASIEGK
jgi:hypothetical protein